MLHFLLTTSTSCWEGCLRHQIYYCRPPSQLDRSQPLAQLISALHAEKDFSAIWWNWTLLWSSWAAGFQNFAPHFPLFSFFFTIHYSLFTIFFTIHYPLFTIFFTIHYPLFKFHSGGYQHVTLHWNRSPFLILLSQLDNCDSQPKVQNTYKRWPFHHKLIIRLKITHDF